MSLITGIHKNGTTNQNTKKGAPENQEHPTCVPPF